MAPAWAGNAAVGLCAAAVVAVLALFAALFVQLAQLRWTLDALDKEAMDDAARAASRRVAAASGALRSFAVVVDSGTTSALDPVPIDMGEDAPVACQDATAQRGSRTARVAYGDSAAIVLEASAVSLALQGAVQSGAVTHAAVGGVVCRVVDGTAWAKSTAAAHPSVPKDAAARLARSVVLLLGAKPSAAGGCSAVALPPVVRTAAASSTLQSVLRGARFAIVWAWGRGQAE